MHSVKLGVLIQYYISVMTDVFVEDEVFIGSWYEWVSLVGQWDSTQEEQSSTWVDAISVVLRDVSSPMET